MKKLVVTLGILTAVAGAKANGNPYPEINEQMKAVITVSPDWKSKQENIKQVIAKNKQAFKDLVFGFQPMGAFGKPRRVTGKELQDRIKQDRSAQKAILGFLDPIIWNRDSYDAVLITELLALQEELMVDMAAEELFRAAEGAIERAVIDAELDALVGDLVDDMNFIRILARRYKDDRATAIEKGMDCKYGFVPYVVRTGLDQYQLTQAGVLELVGTPLFQAYMESLTQDDQTAILEYLSYLGQIRL